MKAWILILTVFALIGCRARTSSTATPIYERYDAGPLNKRPAQIGYNYYGGTIGSVRLNYISVRFDTTPAHLTIAGSIRSSSAEQACSFDIDLDASTALSLQDKTENLPVCKYQVTHSTGHDICTLLGWQSRYDLTYTDGTRDSVGPNFGESTYECLPDSELFACDDSDPLAQALEQWIDDSAYDNCEKHPTFQFAFPAN